MVEAIAIGLEDGVDVNPIEQAIERAKLTAEALEELTCRYQEDTDFVFDSVKDTATAAHTKAVREMVWGVAEWLMHEDLFIYGKLCDLLQSLNIEKPKVEA